MNVKLFGALRDFAPQATVFLRTEPLSVHELKEVLAKELGTSSELDISGLLKKSAIATEDRILRENESLAGHETLHVLPPVCGG